MEAPNLTEHNFSIYNLDMHNIANSKGEDLFHTITSMARVVVDNNAEWKSRSEREPQSAFLLGRTIDNETPNLEGVFSNRKICNGRTNVFLTGIEVAQRQKLIVIHRLDPHFKAVFRGALPNLDQIQSPEKAAWNNPIARADLRDRILFELTRSSDAALTAKIVEQSQHCLRNYNLSCITASWAYGLMLAETFHRDKREVKKFVDNHENLFGDTAVIQEALFYDAAILSHDRHVRTMAAYCGKACLN
jgi:hypothetical protein